MSFISQCLDCKHFHGDQAGWECDAFPKGIPSEISKNQRDHTQPYPGDNGIQFEPLDESDSVGEEKA